MYKHCCLGGGAANRLRVASVDEIWKFSLGLISIILTHLENSRPLSGLTVPGNN